MGQLHRPAGDTVMATEDGRDTPAGRDGNRRLLRWAALGLSVPLLAFALAWLLTSGDYPVAATVAGDPSLSVIEANGYRFHGEVFGPESAPPVIVIHGGPGWDYRSLLSLKALSDHYRVVFYDQRGSGLSPRVPARDLSLEGPLADLDAIVEKYRAGGRAILIGHSWGAMLATTYLGRFPDKVSHAVLAEPGFLDAELFRRSKVRMGPRWEPGYLLLAGRRWFESLHIHGPDADAAADYFLGEAAAHANPEYYCGGRLPPAGTLRWRAGATAMGAIAGPLIESGEGFDLTRGLQDFPRPVLLLASACNRLIGVEQQRRHLARFARAELSVIADSGHMLFAEQPAAALSAVRHYLAQKP
jgi:proline iminopeptidase